MSDIKTTAREMFDKKFKTNLKGYIESGSHIDKLVSLADIKSFIDQIIDLAIAERDKEIVEELKNWTNQNYSRSTQPLHAWVDAKDLIDKINLITNTNK